MSKIILKTDNRKTSVSRSVVRSAISGKFTAASASILKDKRSTKRSGVAKRKKQLT